MSGNEAGSAPCQVRPATYDDLELMGLFSSKMARETEGRDIDPAHVAASLKHVLDDPSLGQMFIAEMDGRVIGSYLVNGREWSEWRNGIYYWITGLYVVPEYRRHGVMFELYRAAVNWVREQPHGLGLRAYVHRDNNLESLLGDGTGEKNNRDEYRLTPMRATPYVVIEVMV
ncbi:MAG: GNAT family N-acetyltransferase [Xanthomonadales bacterium]|nr:GNAT family N-acetyltransferase [Xanthomonadales bacterium]